MEVIAELKEWFFSLGENYGVNPIIFGSIYVGAIPFFTVSLGWLVRNLKNKKPLILPLLSTSFFFVSSYLYLVIAGRNVPFWVYLFIIGIISLGAYSTYKKVLNKVKESENA